MSRMIAFDLDGTLIDSLPGITVAANALLADHGLPLVPERQVAGYVGLGEQVFLDRLIRDTDLDAAQRPELLSSFVLHYVAVGQATPLFPGVTKALQRLKQDGVALALVTNKPRAPLDPVLATTGLSDLFDFVVAGDTLPVRKPDPAPLLYAFETLGMRGPYVGDSPIDSQSAQAAGAPFVLFTEGIRTVPIEALPHDAAFSNYHEFSEVCGPFLK